jgi:hypothetical protein
MCISFIYSYIHILIIVLCLMIHFLIFRLLNAYTQEIGPSVATPNDMPLYE